MVPNGSETSMLLVPHIKCGGQPDSFDSFQI